jgi:hypothetical protein
MDLTFRFPTGIMAPFFLESNRKIEFSFGTPAPPLGRLFTEDSKSEMP